VRSGLEQWFPSSLEEVYGLRQGSMAFVALAMLPSVAAILGAISAGWISDRIFAARRGPVVALMYFAQVIPLALIPFVDSPTVFGAIFVTLSFLFSGPHSLIGTAASMDFGGKEAAATAGGFLDAMQYLGAALVGVGMGWLLERFGWGVWAPSLIAFAILGGILMCLVWKEGGAPRKPGTTRPGSCQGMD